MEMTLTEAERARAGKEATVFYGDKFRRVEYTLASRKRRRARGGGGGSRRRPEAESGRAEEAAERRGRGPRSSRPSP